MMLLVTAMVFATACAENKDNSTNIEPITTPEITGQPVIQPTEKPETQPSTGPVYTPEEGKEALRVVERDANITEENLKIVKTDRFSENGEKIFEFYYHFACDTYDRATIEGELYTVSENDRIFFRDARITATVPVYSYAELKLQADFNKTVEDTQVELNINGFFTKTEYSQNNEEYINKSNINNHSFVITQSDVYNAM